MKTEDDYIDSTTIVHRMPMYSKVLLSLIFYSLSLPPSFQVIFITSLSIFTNKTFMNTNDEILVIVWVRS